MLKRGTNIFVKQRNALTIELSEEQGGCSVESTCHQCGPGFSDSWTQPCTGVKSVVLIILIRHFELTNKEAQTVLCSVVKHAGSG